MESKVNSPKTPGGISKTLLTPCRRVGLSRKFIKKGQSPFISPISKSQNSTDDNSMKESKNVKLCNNVNESKSSIQAEISYEMLKANACISSPPLLDSTPSRDVPVSKNSCKIITEIKDFEGTLSSLDNNSKSPQNKHKTVTKLARSNSKKNQKLDAQLENNAIISTENTKFDIQKCNNQMPNNLTKECIVVIQKKMLKNMKRKNEINIHEKVMDKKIANSQTLFDSDSDDLPLCNVNNKQSIEALTEDCIGNNLMVKKESKITTDPIQKENRVINIKSNIPLPVKESQISLEDDDDFEFIRKKTIVVKKSYNKLVKPSRAKSTGSITQNDIDEIKARIDMKKKLLIAKTMSEDTKDLRNLIKKWQKGCQDALFELFDLMKKKLPDSQNMDYSEILKTLNIPPELVGYDADNDCFITPDDSSIILTSLT